ncbi:uncharacterized protein Triagg1_1010 [Trichoderma aggressivum f. europaeum]|uniref:DUF7492 domain-containing protein n=1 Tax=Trichoderma aggressivum f. europaeum TaxID=173218 RepID=A0AAE1M4N9_9HYPO|nr:hypothetical protein Triagg1_1010 [Trichoderma aggressivum f. europaeum]
MTAKPHVGLKAAVVATLATVASGHSWIERAYKVLPNGTMVGAEGYARGWVPRTSTNPPFQDTIPQWILPAAGQSAYSGDEVLNKYKMDENPPFPMLEAAPGDHIAIIHLENGHTTLPQNQPKKPLNRGTVFLYGTSQPKESERLFDVHLVWNKKGTGGDGRGVLLATRNYDDGQCYQPNPGPISTERAAKLAPEGAKHEVELGCQSTLQLPSDLKPGSIYTIYWYWDWPDLNADNINFDATTNGLYPWAGTFMRGEKDPNGFTMAAIAKNESYASTIDIKITGDSSAKHANLMSEFLDNQDIYTKAIKSQMASNFEVNVDANGANDSPSSAPVAPVAPPAPSAVAPQPSQVAPTAVVPQPSQVPPTSAAGKKTTAEHTVTRLVTAEPSTVWKTLYRTVSADQGPATSASPTVEQPRPTVFKTITMHVPVAVASPATSTTTITTTTTSTSTSRVHHSASTVFMTITKHVPAATPPSDSPVEAPTSTLSSSRSSVEPIDNRPTVTPFMPIVARRNWAFGHH